MIHPAANPNETAEARPPVHWFSAVQFGFSALAVLILWGMAFSIGLWGIYMQISYRSSISGATPMFMLAASLAASGLLVLPSAVFSLLRIMNKPVKTAARWQSFKPVGALLLFLVVLTLGHVIASKTSWAWLVLPPLHVLAVALPVWLTLWAGKRRIVSGSPQRAWGAFASGLILAPAIIMVLEIIVMVVVGVSIVVFIPETIHEMERIAQLAEIGRLDETKLLEIIGGILQKPAAVIIMLGFFAGAVPLIEELFKPVGVWLLAGRRLSPAEGMVMGMISGAGYAFFETLIGISTPDGWGVAILTRIGTGVIHILTTGLTGWALAMAWSQKRYLRLVAAYFTSVVIHGLWNASAVLSALAAVSSMGNADGVIAPHWIVSGWIVLLVLTIAGTILLFKFNAVFRQQNDEPAAAELEPAA